MMDVLGHCWTASKSHAVTMTIISKGTMPTTCDSLERAWADWREIDETWTTASLTWAQDESVCACLPDNLFVCLSVCLLPPSLPPSLPACLSVYQFASIPLFLLDELPPYLSVCPNVCQSVSLHVCLLPAYKVVLGCKGSFTMYLLCFQLPVRYVFPKSH